MNNVRDYLNAAKGWFPLGLAAVYVLGFVIVGLHLAGYGASTLDLIKAQYLAAGFWFCFALFAYFGALKVVRSVMEFLPRRKRLPGFRQVGEARQRLSLSLLANFLMAIWIGGILFTARHVPMARFREVNDAIWQIGLVSLAFALSMAFLDISYHLRNWFRERAKDESGSRDTWTVAWAGATFFLVVVFLLSVKTFAITIYRVIPFSLGGGEPRQVIFWLGPTTNPPQDSFVQRDGSNPYSVAYELLVENENSFVVISPKDGQRAIEFDRKSVGAVIVLGKRRGPAHFLRGATEATKAP